MYGLWILSEDMVAKQQEFLITKHMERDGGNGFIDFIIALHEFGGVRDAQAKLAKGKRDYACVAWLCVSRTPESDLVVWFGNARFGCVSVSLSMEAVLAAAFGDLMGRRMDASLFDGKVCVGGWVVRLVVECQMGVDVVRACLCSQERRLCGEREEGGER